MDMDAAAAVAESYKGTAQIVQGVLIALSAIIAVAGYFVKARLDRKEKIREMQLKHKSTMLKDLVGPAQAMAYGGLMARINFIACQAFPGEFGQLKSDETQSELWFFEAGPYGAKCKEMVHNHTSDNATQLWTFVGREKEKQMLKDTTSKLAVSYRRFMRQIINCYYQPLSDLLNQHMNVLPLPDKEEFKLKYPGANASVALRKLFFIQVVVWTNEMSSIIQGEWDQGVYDRLFPASAPFPYKLCQYLAQMLTTLKTEIEELTHKAVSSKSNDDDTQVKDMNKRHALKKKYSRSGGGEGSGEGSGEGVGGGTNNSKYVSSKGEENA